MSDKPHRGQVTGPELPAGRARPRRCPICRRAAVEAHRPFCSKRCADIDLGHWLGERYRVPAGADADDAAPDDDEGRSADPPRG